VKQPLTANARRYEDTKQEGVIIELMALFRAFQFSRFRDYS
jgi:hypothetical protein